MKTKLGKLLREHRSFLLFISLMLVFRSAVADWSSVPTGSMQPTIVEGDRILIDKLAYDVRVPFTSLSLQRLAEPQRGDIVVFDSAAAGKMLVKRLVGVPGDTVEMRDNRLFLNGSPLPYRDIRREGDAVFATEELAGVSHPIRLSLNSPNRYRSFGPVTVPKDHYLMLGDNRDNSADSRMIGFVPRHELRGRTETVVLSFDYDDYYLPRAERFWHTL